MTSEFLTDSSGLRYLKTGLSQAKTACVILHGYGANAQDLFGLNSLLSGLPVECRFPDAPLSVDIGMGFEGRAWFPIDAQELQRSLQTGEFRQFRKSRMAGIEEAQGQLLQFLKNLLLEFESLHLAGFSQGAMLASDLALASGLPVQSLSIFSGIYINEANWETALSRIKSPLHVFQSHGTEDPVLDFRQALKLKEIFEAAPQDQVASYEFHSFSGGHGIPPNVLHLWKDFMTRLF